MSKDIGSSPSNRSMEVTPNVMGFLVVTRHRESLSLYSRVCGPESEGISSCGQGIHIINMKNPMINGMYTSLANISVIHQVN